PAGQAGTEVSAGELIFKIILAQLATYGSSVYRQNTAKIRLDQHPHGVSAELLWQFSRRGADAALEPKGHRAGTGANCAFLNDSAARALDRGEDLFPAHMPSANVVQIAVVRLANQRIDRLD